MMRNYFQTANRIIAHFADAAAANESGFTEAVDLAAFVDKVFAPFTHDFWEGSPSPSYSRRQINDELGAYFSNPEGYIDGRLEEIEYACSPQCIKDIIFEVNRRLQESDEYEETQSYRLKEVSECEDDEGNG